MKASKTKMWRLEEGSGTSFFRVSKMTFFGLEVAILMLPATLLLRMDSPHVPLGRNDGGRRRCGW